MIPHNKPTLGKEEENAALRVIRSGWLAQGNQVNAFEDEFCQFLNLPQGHSVAVSSGTAALFLALWALNAKNKIVAFPVYVCSALRNAIAMVGAREYLVDIAEGTPNIDLENVVVNKPDIAILPHMYGIPIDINALDGVNIIEDCCQSLGATVDGKATGLKGDLGIFSFYATKLITSGGQGGMVISKDKTMVDNIRDYLEFDMRKDNKKRFNFQMTELQAAVGRAQLKKLPFFLIRRNEIFEYYLEAGLPLLNGYSDRLCPIRYRAVLLTELPHQTIQLLEGYGIKAIIPIQDWELIGGKKYFPNALKLSLRTVSLPLYPLLSDSDLEKITSVLERVKL